MHSLEVKLWPVPEIRGEGHGVWALAGLLLVAMLVAVYFASKRSSATPWEPRVVGGGTADEPSRVELLPRSPIPVSEG